MAALVHAAGQKLRFRVGQTVICSVEGGWQQGIVVQIWPDDYLSAYEVLLQDEDGNHVVVPEDNDKYVRESFVSKQKDKRSRKEKKRDKRRKKKAASRSANELHVLTASKDFGSASASPKKLDSGRSSSSSSSSSLKYSNPLSDRINHSKLLTLVFEEATELFKQQRQRLNDLAIQKNKPKEKIAKAKTNTPQSVDQCLSEVKGKAGKTFFPVLVGHEEYLYKTFKSLTRTKIAPHTIDLHGCSREEALTRLNKALPGWINDAMQDFPWTLPVNIIVGGGNQLLAQVVEHWIREEKQVAKRFA
eukprot:scaffold4876_cov64-Cyclotella_meneghiniana.AAC.3